MSENADRRRYRRYHVDLQGLLSQRDAPVGRCIVHDVCAGGVLVECRESPAGKRVEPGQRVRIDAKVDGAEGVGSVTMNGIVVWSRDGYFGLSFDRLSPRLVDELRQHRDDVEAADVPPIRSTASEARARAKLRHVAGRLLPPLLRELLRDANERLLDEADRVASNTEQSQLFADMNALDDLRKGDRLVNQILQESESGDAQAESEPAVGSGELTLIDPDEFERWLEASRAATVLERHFGETLGALASRLAALRDVDSPPVLDTPFEPQHFTKAIKVAASDVGLGPRSRALLFDAAVRVLSEGLVGFYRELDHTLDALGAPAARHPPLRIIRAESGQAPAESPVDAPGDGLDDSSSDGSSATVGPGWSGAGPRLSLDPALLARAQAQSRAQRAEMAGDLMREVVDQPGMTESLQGWLGVLDGPLRRQAACDPGLFQDPTHPLREIIDALGHLQLFRPDPDGPIATDGLRQEIDQLLRPIVEGAVDDATVRAVADRVSGLTEEQSRRYQQNIERVVEASEGRERVRFARRRVVALLNERYAASEVPEVLLDLLDAGWRSVLELAALRDERTDEAVADRLRLIDVLVAKLGGQAYDSRADALGDAELLRRLGGELASASFDPFRVAAVEKRLRDEISGDNRSGARLVRFTPLDDSEDPAARLDAPTGITAGAWSRILADCERVRVGDRLRFLTAPADQPHELRVAWLRDDGALLTLVDHRGLKVRDIERPDLALGLYRREIQLEQLEGTPLSEQAIDRLLSRMEERLNHESSHDSLTGLINRNQFKTALEQMLRRPDGAVGSLVWIDVDQFRLVNDIHGYEAGDRLLVAIARLLEQRRGSSVLAHIGGDRFAMLFPELSSRDVRAHADGVREKVASMPFSVAGRNLSVSVSIGLVDVDPETPAVGGVLQAADDALSVAKANGGNSVHGYSDDDPEIQQHRESVRWVAQVDDALQGGRLHLRCQPIVPVRPDSDLTPHYEVLLGVAGSDQEPIPIAEFIDAAERYKRMRSVDRWVTRTVMEWIARHRADMPRLHGLAVNLSGQTASDPAFVDYVRQAFQRTGINPSWLSFEVTETAAISDLSASAGIVQDLKRLGCRVALDDFGSGLASYSYLKELPVDWLKIDGVFVRKIAQDSGDFAVVKSINEIGQFLGKQTIAEYVADEAILRRVVEIGVDYAQGYEIAAPSLLDSLVETPSATGPDSGSDGSFRNSAAARSRPHR